jgi:hypothetical protein
MSSARQGAYCFMATSRKIMLAALLTLFFSQFLRYEPGGHTTMTMDLGRNLTYGGLPYAGQTGWQLHWFSFLAPLIIFEAYLFYSSARRMYVYVLALVVCVLFGLGSNYGGTLGFVSILITLTAILFRWREPKPGQTTPP